VVGVVVGRCLCVEVEVIFFCLFFFARHFGSWVHLGAGWHQQPAPPPPGSSRLPGRTS
jgi:hypothetical protein